MHANIVIQEIANGFLVGGDQGLLGGRSSSPTYYPTEEALRADAIAIIDRAVQAGREAQAEMERQRVEQQNYAINRRELAMGAQEVRGHVVGRFDA